MQAIELKRNRQTMTQITAIYCTLRNGITMKIRVDYSRKNHLVQGDCKDRSRKDY